MEFNNNIAVYPTSANPPTWGHGDILYRFSKMYRKVYWVIGDNPHKVILFSVEQRLQMLQAYLRHYKIDNVTVDYTSGSIASYAKKKKAKILLRGLRNTTDFYKEFEMSVGNRGISKSLETVCMFSKPHYACISSGLVRELLMINERITQYVLPEVGAMIVKFYRETQDSASLPEPTTTEK